MKRLHTFLLALLATCLPVCALSLRVLPWDDDVAERKLAIAHGKKSLEIGYLHPAARSAPISLPADAAGLRLEATDRIGDDGKPEAVILRMPSGVKNPLLLILPDKKSKAGVRTLIIEDDQSVFAWGTIRLINVSTKPLVFRWDRKAKPVPPGWNPVNVSPGGKSRNMEVFLYLKDDLKKPLYSAVWEHRADMRQLVFVVPRADSSLGPFEFKFIPETRLPAEGE